jgi:hypothetical protein
MNVTAKNMGVSQQQAAIKEYIERVKPLLPHATPEQKAKIYESLAKAKAKLSEAASIERKESFRGRVTPDIEYIVRDDEGNIVRYCKTKKEARMWYDMVTLSKEEMWAKYPELKVNEVNNQHGLAEGDRPGMKDGRPYSDPLRRHPGNDSYMTPEYLIQKYQDELKKIAAGPYKRPKDVAMYQARIAKLQRQQGVAEGSEAKDDLIWMLNNFDYYTDNGSVYVNDAGEKIARYGSNWKHQSGKMGRGAEELGQFLSSNQGLDEVNYTKSTDYLDEK